MPGRAEDGMIDAIADDLDVGGGGKGGKGGFGMGFGFGMEMGGRGFKGARQPLPMKRRGFFRSRR